MDIPLDEVIHFDAISSASTGAAADADSTPTFAVYEESTDTDIGVGGNMTKRTSLTGNYRGSFTASAANGFEVGKWYNVIGSATIGGIACKAILKAFRIVAAESVAGKPKVDVDAFGGTAGTFSGGRPEVNATHWAGTAVGSATVRSDLINIAGSAVNTSSAQLGVNVVNFGGSAGTFASGIPAVNATQWGGTAVASANVLIDGAITAAKIASDAITDAKVAADVTIASVTGAVGSVTGNVGGNVTGSVGSIATGGITASSFAAGAIDNAAIAADAIGSSELAASAVTEIQNGLATQTSVDTIDGIVDAIKLKTDNLPSDPADASDIASAFGTLQTSVNDLPTNAELATALAAADDAVLAAIAALNNLSSAGAQSAVTTALTTALTEGYRGTGATGSVRDMLYEIISHLGESSISGTTKTLKKIDGSTTAKTFTLDSATTPTSITETT